MDKARSVASFLSVARAGSFRQAAIEAGVTPQSMSKTVRQLEVALGVRLFHRTTRKLSLTEEGQQLLEYAEPGLRVLDEALDMISGSGQNVGGVIRISAPPSVGVRILVPIIREFGDLHPEVSFDVQLDDHFTDLVSAKTDIGFRAGTAPERNVVARHLTPIRQLICASPDYLQRYGTPRDVEELMRHRCTGFRHPNSGRTIPWEIQQNGALAYREVPAVALFNNVEAEVEAVRCGIGIGQLTGYMINGDLAAGRLIVILPELATARLGLFMYYAERKHMPLRVRLFIDFVMASASRLT